MKRHKPVVLVVTPFFSPNVGGVETHLDDLVSVLNRHGIRAYVSAYSPLTTAVAYERHENVGSTEIFRFPWPGGGLFHKVEHSPPVAMAYLFPGLFFQTVWILFRHPEITVVHAQGFVAALVVRCAGLLFRKRTVMSTHALYRLPDKPLVAGVFRWILAGFDRILTLSEASTSELQGSGVPAERMGRYTYWVDQELFRPGDRRRAKRTLDLEHRKVVLFVARLIRKKGTDMVIRLAELLEKKGYMFGVIGTGPEEESLRTAAARLSNLRFWGRTDNRRLVRYLQAGDLLLVPSLYDEGMARVVMEGLSCGLPVVASRRGSLPEMLRDARITRLVEPSTDEFAAAITSVLSRPVPQRTALCRRYAVRHFSEKNAEAILSAYDL